MKTLRVIFSSMSLQMKNSFSRNMFQFCLLISPVFSAILLYEMFKNSGHDNFTTYVILGSGLISLWGCICFSSIGDINRERWNKTLPIIYVAPAGFGKIMLGKILGNTLLSLVTLVLSFLTVKILYNAPFIIADWPFFILSLFSVIISFVVVSVFLAYLLTLSRKTALYMNAAEAPIIFLCGFAFPVTILPVWVQPISYCLSPTWAINLMRMSIGGIDDIKEYLVNLGILAAITTAYLIIIFLLRKTIDRQVRKNGTLEMA